MNIEQGGLSVAQARGAGLEELAAALEDRCI